MKSRLLASTIAAVCLISVSSIASANQITNGGFESGLTGWTTSGLTCSGVGSGFSVATGGCFGYDADPGPRSGAAAAYLGTAAGGGVLQQTFDTAFGQSFAVDFYLAVGAYNGVYAPNSFQFQTGSAAFLLLDAPAQGFAHYSYSFVASGPTTTLKITHGDAPSFFILDDVSVNSVPEPATLALFGLGLAGLGFAKRRRRA